MPAVLSKVQATILEQLERSPLGRKIQAEADAAVLAERQAAATEVTRLQRELEAGLPKLTAAVDRAAEALRAAEQALAAARENYRLAATERHNLVARTEAAQARQRLLLRRSCSPAIDALVAEMHDLAEAARSWRNPHPRPDRVGTPTREERQQDLEQAERHDAAGRAQLARLRAINEARRVADDELRYAALSAPELEARLAALRSAVAAAGEAVR